MQWLIPHIASTDRVSSVWASRELLYDSDLNALYYGDGASSGGILLATGTVTGITPAISGSNGSFTFSTVSFGNLNGLSFYSSNGSIVGSYSVPSVTQFLNTSQSSLFQLTADNSLSLGTGYTTHTHSQYINTSNSSLFRLTADNSLLQFTSNTSNITSNALNTSVSSLFLTSQSNQAFSASGGSSNFQTLVFNNANGLTFSNNGGSIQASYTVPNAGSSLNISAGTTSNNLIALTLNDSNGISFGINGSVLTATVKTDYQTSGNYLTTAMESGAGSRFVNTSAGLNLTNISATLASNSISLSVAAPVTTAGLISDIKVSAGTLSSNRTDLTFNNSNGVSFGLETNGIITASHNGLTTARASNDAIGLNTAQTNVTWTVGSAGLSLNAEGYAGTGTSESGALAFTLNSNGLAIDANSVAGVGTSATNASVTLNSNGLAISVADPGGGLTLSSWQNNNFLVNTTLGTMGQSTSVLGNCYIPAYISMEYLRKPMSISFVTTSGGTSNGATGRGLWYNTLDAAIFVANTGASSLSYSRVSYTSVGVTQEYSFSANATAGSQYSISYRFTFPCLTNSTSLYTTSTAVSTSNIQLLSTPPTNMAGIRYLDIPWNTSITPGNYVFVFGNSSSGATSGFSAMSSLRINTISFFLISQINSGIHRWGSNQNNSAVFGAGSYSIAGGATTASLDATRITTRASQAFDFFQLVGSTV